MYNKHASHTLLENSVCWQETGLFINYDASLNANLQQGWEFAPWFSERIIAKKWVNNEGMSNSLKTTAICSFAHFWWATWANRSNSLIFSERPEQFAHIAHFWWATWTIGHSAHKKEGMSESFIFLKTYKKRSKKIPKTMHSVISFEQIARFLWEKEGMSDLQEKRAIR